MHVTLSKKSITEEKQIDPGNSPNRLYITDHTKEIAKAVLSLMEKARDFLPLSLEVWVAFVGMHSG